MKYTAYHFKIIYNKAFNYKIFSISFFILTNYR